MVTPTQSEMAQKMAEAQDTHSLAAHKIVDQLRATLSRIADFAEKAKHDLSDTVGARAIIIHGPTGTGKSTVVPWEAMRWLEEHCADRVTSPWTSDLVTARDGKSPSQLPKKYVEDVEK